MPRRARRVDVATLSEWAACWLYLCRADALRRAWTASGGAGRSRTLRRALTCVPRQSTHSTRRGSTAAWLALSGWRYGDRPRHGDIGPTCHSPPAGQATFSAQATLIALAAAARTACRYSATSQRDESGPTTVGDGRTLEALRGHLTVAEPRAVGSLDAPRRGPSLQARPARAQGNESSTGSSCATSMPCSQLDSRPERRRAPRSGAASTSSSVPGDARRGRAARHRLGARRRPVTARCVDRARSGGPADILAWAERLRGNALGCRSILPRTGAAPTAAELRRVDEHAPRTTGPTARPHGRSARAAPSSSRA